MYSVVLLAALSTGGDVPAGLFNRGCCGGSSSHHVSCSGGCHGTSCSGSHRKHRSHGCSGGNYACTGASCHGSSCFGGHRKHRGHNNCCGCTGSATIVSCTGTVVPAPVVAPPVKGKIGLDNVAPATLIVSVPAEARLTVDGQITSSTSTQRVFVTPALSLDRVYNYTIEAEYVRDGKLVKISKEVAVKAGDETRVRFDDEASLVASR